MECAARERSGVVNEAVPAPSSTLLPMGVVPSRKVTWPVGVPVPGKVTITVAVNVTGWPNTDGFTELVTAVVVLALLTVWVNVVDSLAALFWCRIFF